MRRITHGRQVSILQEAHIIASVRVPVKFGEMVLWLEDVTHLLLKKVETLTLMIYTETMAQLLPIL